MPTHAHKYVAIGLVACSMLMHEILLTRICALRIFRTLRSAHGAAEALRMLGNTTDLDARPGVAGLPAANGMGEESAAYLEVGEFSGTARLLSTQQGGGAKPTSKVRPY